MENSNNDEKSEEIEVTAKKESFVKRIQFSDFQKSIGEIVGLVGIALIVVLALTVGMSSYLGAEKPLVAVTTGSMLPIYNGFQDRDNTEIYVLRGDLFLVKKEIPIYYNLGDVIVFDVLGLDEPVVHRIVYRWNDDGITKFITNGDNNDLPDSWTVSESEVIGRVVFRIPHIGWMLLLAQTDFGRIVILLLAVIILFSGSDDEEDEDKQKESEKNTYNEDPEDPPIVIIKNRSLDEVKKLRPLLNRKWISKRNFFSVIFIMIISSFLLTNIVFAFISSPQVNLYSFSSRNDLSDVDTLNVATRREWSINSTHNAAFIPIYIQIRSGGLFNNIQSFNVVANHEGIYHWNIIYDYIGTKQMKGGIIIFAEKDATSLQVELSTEVYSRGLLASRILTKTYTINIIGL